MYHNFLTKRFQLKSRLSMAFQPSADSFGIRRLGFKCSWWIHRKNTRLKMYSLNDLENIKVYSHNGLENIKSVQPQWLRKCKKCTATMA